MLQCVEVKSVLGVIDKNIELMSEIIDIDKNQNRTQEVEDEEKFYIFRIADMCRQLLQVINDQNISKEYNEKIDNMVKKLL